MTISQIRKFRKNDDTSTISFKKFTSDNCPTYTICFEDNDDVGGIYKTIFIHGSERKVYFDGNVLRLEKSDVADWKDMWYPNTTVLNITDFIGKSESMYAPIPISWQYQASLVYLIVFNETYLIPPTLYKRLLKGVINTTVEARFDRNYFLGSTNVTYATEGVANIDFSNSTINLKDFLEDYSAKTTTDLTIGWVDDEYKDLQTNCFMPEFLCRKQKALKVKLNSKKYFKFPFRLSYQDPTRVCYTPKLNHSITKVHDYLTLDLEKMSELLTNNNLGSELPYLRIYIHMQGQFIRTLGREVANYATPDLLNEHCEFITGVYSGTKKQNWLCYGSKIIFLLSQVSFLKKRHDGVIPCDKDLKNEDNKIITSIMRKVGCIPSYWKELAPKNVNYPVCKTAFQYEKIYGYVSNLELSRALFTPPCEEMLVVTNIMKERGRRRKEKYMDKNTKKFVSYLDLQFIQGSEMFQQIDNVQDFGVESCWSAIGGFVGIFVGYSLMQLPELLAEYCIFLKRKIMSHLQKITTLNVT